MVLGNPYYVDEVIVLSPDEENKDIRGKKAAVVAGVREKGELWYALATEGGRTRKVKVRDTVPTGKRLLEKRHAKGPMIT